MHTHIHEVHTDTATCTHAHAHTHASKHECVYAFIAYELQCNTSSADKSQSGKYTGLTSG